MEQRFTFDQIADVYKAARPDYPDALIEDVLSFAELKQNDNILEVGCGTGQATKVLLREVFQLLRLIPDQNCSVVHVKAWQVSVMLSFWR